MTEFMLRFMLAGLLVASLPIVAERLGTFAAGALLVFPVVTAIGLSFIAHERGLELMLQSAWSGLLSLPAVAAFLFATIVVGRATGSAVRGLSSGFLLWIIVVALTYSLFSTNLVRIPIRQPP